jgi:1-acyl-sn-glycerol-3-phosphate acyltransferase
LAVEAELPVVPITIVGSRHVMTKGHLIVRPGAVSLTIHDPIETADVPRDGVRDMADRVRDVVVASAS